MLVIQASVLQVCDVCVCGYLKLLTHILTYLLTHSLTMFERATDALLQLKPNGNRSRTGQQEGFGD